MECIPNLYLKSYYLHKIGEFFPNKLTCTYFSNTSSFPSVSLAVPPFYHLRHPATGSFKTRRVPTLSSQVKQMKRERERESGKASEKTSAINERWVEMLPTPPISYFRAWGTLHYARLSHPSLMCTQLWWRPGTPPRLTKRRQNSYMVQSQSKVLLSSFRYPGELWWWCSEWDVNISQNIQCSFPSQVVLMWVSEHCHL